MGVEMVIDSSRLTMKM